MKVERYVERKGCTVQLLEKEGVVVRPVINMQLESGAHACAVESILKELVQPLGGKPAGFGGTYYASEQVRTALREQQFELGELEKKLHEEAQEHAKARAAVHSERGFKAEAERKTRELEKENRVLEAKAERLRQEKEQLSQRCLTLNVSIDKVKDDAWEIISDLTRRVLEVE